jgi:hypothetical protein
MAGNQLGLVSHRYERLEHLLRDTIFKGYHSTEFVSS